MRKEFLFFALLIFIVLIECVESYEMNVGIAPFINASLSVATNETTYYPEEIVDIINTLENKGNSESTGNLTTRLFSPNGSEIFMQDWFNILLEQTTSPQYYSTSYDFSSDADLGMYIVTSNFSYDNKIASASTEFELQAPLTTVPSTVPGEGGGGGGGPEEKETTTAIVTTVATTIVSTVKTTILLTITTTEITTTTIRVVTMPGFVLMPCLIYIIILIIVDTVILLILRMKKLKLVMIILTLIIVSVFTVVLIPSCWIWIVLVTLVMITIAVFMRIGKKPSKRSRKVKKKN